jgi:hypothetical protein
MFILVIFYSFLALSIFLLIVIIKNIKKNWRNVGLYAIILFCCLSYARMIHSRFYWTNTFSRTSQQFKLVACNYYKYYKKLPTIQEIQNSQYLSEFLYIHSLIGGDQKLNIQYSTFLDTIYFTIYSYGYDNDDDSLKTLLKGTNSEILNPFSNGDLVIAKGLLNYGPKTFRTK